MNKGILAAIAYLGKQKGYKIVHRGNSVTLQQLGKDFHGFPEWYDITKYCFETAKLLEDR